MYLHVLFYSATSIYLLETEVILKKKCTYIYKHVICYMRKYLTESVVYEKAC